jgi:tetratricopeptide (TPR) repeat protein
MVGPYSATDRNEKKESLLLAGYLNLALVHNKLNNFQEALKNCGLALEIDGKNVKALFRRGQAHFGLKEFEKAKQDFDMVLFFEQTNKAAAVELKKVNEAIKAHKQREKQTYANMFDKFANKDREKELRLAGNVWKELKDEVKRDFSSVDTTPS